MQLADVRAELNRGAAALDLAGVTVVEPGSTGRRQRLDGTLRRPAAGVQRQGHHRRRRRGDRDGQPRHAARRPHATVGRTHDTDATIAAGASVGPFAYLRPGTRLGERGKIGTFVEVKNADIGAGSKVPHLTYVGDATIGEQSNIGASSVFVNYDGVRKHRTVVGSHVRTGSDNTFVAPLRVGDGAYTGAGAGCATTSPRGPRRVGRRPTHDRGLGREEATRYGGRRGRRPRGRGGQPTGRRRVTQRSWRHTTVSAMSATPKKNLMLFSGRAHPELAEQVAKHLDVTITPQSAYNFANGEIFVRFQESVRGSDAFVLQSHSAPINDQIMEHLIMVDALKRASAKRITVVMPFWGYSRQDKKHRGREPISARLIADLFKTAGADRIMTVDLHTAQIQGFFDGPVDHLFALPVLAEHIKRTYAGQELAVVSPDSGRVRLAERWAETLGGTPLAFIHKTRDPNRPNEAVANRVVGDIEGRLCVVIDDMIDTGGTVSKAVQALSARAPASDRRGHPGLLSGPASERLATAARTR